MESRFINVQYDRPNWKVHLNLHCLNWEEVYDHIQTQCKQLSASAKL